MFWQIPDGQQILLGHLPTTIPYAIQSGPLLSQEWMFEAVLAWAAQHSVYGSFVILCALAAAATPIFVYWAIRAFGISDVAAGIVAFLVVGSRFVGSAIRPETFAVDAFAIELFLLAQIKNRAWMIPVVVFWANLHASVVLAPIAAFAFFAGEFLNQKTFNRPVIQSLTLAIGVVLATLITPHGFHLWSYAFSLAVAPNPTREHLDTWRALTFDGPGSLAAVLPGLLLIGCFGIVRLRQYTSEIILAIICLILTITHERYAMFLVAGWAPALARSLDMRAGLEKLAAQRPRTTILAILPLIVFAVASGIPKLSTPVEPVGPWQAAAGIITDHHLAGNTYAPYMWAAYLPYRHLPVRLLIDAHGDPYGTAVWDDHLSLRNVRSNWRDVLVRRQITLVVMPVDSALAQAMLLDTSWRQVETRDGIVALSKQNSVSQR